MKPIPRLSSRKAKILASAKRLMLEKGYVATTVDEICADAEVSKGSFFHHFKNKEEMGKELVECVAAASREKMTEGIRATATDDPLDRVYAYLDWMVKMSRGPESKGCLIGTFAQELSQSHPQIREVCQNNFKRNLQVFKKDLAAAKSKYAPKASFDVTGLADCFMAIFQGTMILMKANQDCSLMEKTITHYRGYLEHLFGR